MLNVFLLSKAIGRGHVLVAEMNEAFSHRPSAQLQTSLISEEHLEAEDAIEQFREFPSASTAHQVLKEAADFVYVAAGYQVAGYQRDRYWLSGLIRNLSDELEEIGVEADWVLEAVVAVHASNMSKVGEDGLPIRNEAGKVMKGPNYVEPNLDQLAGNLLDAYEQMEAEREFEE